VAVLLYTCGVSEQDRRRAERIRLDVPIRGEFGDSEVLVLEIGLLGARFEHDAPLLPGTTARLRLNWEEEDLDIQARVARTELQPLLSERAGRIIVHSGVEFVEASGESAKALRSIIVAHVARTIEQLKANAHGGGDQKLDQVPFLRSEPKKATSPRYFISWRLDASGSWHRTEVLKARQPADGFAIAPSQSEEEVALLRKTYEEASEEGRKMIRVCAELALTEGETVPPKPLV
jgi:predicted RNase H-like HicB family nuclease